MSYFTNRPRAYSKPTKEETKELSNLLSKCSAHDLRLIMLSAATESPNVVQLFMKIMRNDDSTPDPHPQPVQSTQQQTTGNPCYPDTGLLTPIDISEDSEMSGTENGQSYAQQHHLARPESFMPTSSCFTSGTPFQHEIPSLKRPNKRKSLADRDDNFPSSPHSSFLSKRRKPSVHRHPSDHQSSLEKTYCLNCGLWTTNSKFENLHGCIYHPGDFSFDGTKCSWSCCRNSDLKSRGCLITRHNGLSKDAWLHGSDRTDSLLDGQQRTTARCDDHGQMSQYARIISIKG